MAKPTTKNPEIERFLQGVSGTSRVQAINGNKCSWCAQPATDFKDELSRKEYTISGFCQKCQDLTFGE